MTHVSYDHNIAMIAATDNPRTELTDLLEQFRSSIEGHILDNIKEFTDPSAAPNRRGSDGQIIDLDWEGKHCVGKEKIWIGKENIVLGKNCMRYSLNSVVMWKK